MVGLFEGRWMPHAIHHPLLRRKRKQVCQRVAHCLPELQIGLHGLQ